ncbi:hypothetical protein [Magnetospirillum sp. 15-1]|uniref:hypothetical protein n=1 Tax=Magnetospirillum sp. 15-1 TaxID=1979370 RepID=UPI00114295D2|nr:hypothetical protein [Magnetospirillum sp. 15-1]
MALEISPSGESEAIVLIKAAPQVGVRHGETVCCAAIDLYGNWLRLYPVSFRHLDEGKKFGRWDRIRFRWRMPKDDGRAESRRIDQNALTITGELKPVERERFLARSIVTSLDKERSEGRSLALLKAEITGFHVERKSDDEIKAQKAKFEALHAQPDLFNTRPLIPYTPAPYKFKYSYRTDDGRREGTCQDWEIEATFFKWSNTYGESKALENMQTRFGEEYPRKGMLLAMGTHSLHPDTWLINGIIRLDEVQQLTLL